VLKVKEYFLFDPFGDYLKPLQLRGYRLHKGKYAAIPLVDGRMPSQVLDLHLETIGDTLRLFDPKTGSRLLTLEERTKEAERAEAAMTEEVKRLREQIETMRKKNGI
jgi:hypothetical protein